MIYELNGYRLFAILEFLQDNPDYDDELGSLTALVILSFIYSQHQKIQGITRILVKAWLSRGSMVFIL